MTVNTRDLNKTPLLMVQDSADPMHYLRETEIFDYSHPRIAEAAASLQNAGTGQVEIARAAYEFVRDTIDHSGDAGREAVIWTASDVLTAGHGICFAKAHLLTALLRCMGIPAGLCYQRLVLDDANPGKLTLHGMSAVWLNNRWIRLDARGNKPGVNAQFSLEGEQLAFPVRLELGEKEYPAVYADPLPGLLTVMKQSTSVSWLMQALPDRIDRSEKA